MKTKYDVLYIDPPYWYQGRVQHGGKGATFTSGAHDYYPTMTAVELAVLPIRSLLANNAIAFIWTTGPQLEVTLKLLPFWGLKYKTVAFVWNKIKVNPGAYTMSQIEFVIAAIHGAIPKPRGARGVRQYLIEKRTTHSRKPSEIRDRIVKMFPTQRKLEMFAREAAAGWDRWGNEAPRGNGLISI